MRHQTVRTAAVILAMPSEGAFGEILHDHFARLGWHVRRAASAEEVHSLLDGSRPYLLVCDHSFGARDEIVALLKTGWPTNTIPIVTLHTRFEDLRHPARLLVLGDMAVFEPISVHPFLRSMDQLLAQASEEAAVFERQLHVRFPAREEEILRAFDNRDLQILLEGVADWDTSIDIDGGTTQQGVLLFIVPKAETGLVISYQDIYADQPMYLQLP